MPSREKYFEDNDMGSLKVKCWKKIYHANINQNKAGRAIKLSKTEKDIK